MFFLLIFLTLHSAFLFILLKVLNFSVPLNFKFKLIEFNFLLKRNGVNSFEKTIWWNKISLWPHWFVCHKYLYWNIRHINALSFPKLIRLYDGKNVNENYFDQKYNFVLSFLNKIKINRRIWFVTSSSSRAVFLMQFEIQIFL